MGHTVETPATTPLEERPLRADARRNRERILRAANEVFAAKGQEAQMDDVAAQAGVGVGTVYRHFPTKKALMGALVAQKFAEFAANAREALEMEDPWEAFAGSFRRNAELMARDAGVQYVLMSTDVVLEYIAPQKQDLEDAMGKLVTRAKRAGALRKDFKIEDMGMLMCGLCSTMGGAPIQFDWRRHMEIILDGLRPQPKNQGDSGR
jgi:AcrR family transcriptional regulator